MAPRGSSAATTVGGKGSALSSAAVYAVSRGLSELRIDAAALEKLSFQSSSKKTATPPPIPLDPRPDPSPNPSCFLSSEEVRAALAVLLNKLVLADPPVRPALPALIEQTLALNKLESVTFGSSIAFLDSLCRLNDKKIEEIGVTGGEIGIVNDSCFASTAICAILDCCSSALVRVLDAVVALSCEAARADVAALDLLSSGDGFSMKDETDVAADMKVLVFGSKLVGQIDSASFSEIPTVHGGFREDVRLLHGRTRVELNSAVKVKKKTVCRGNYAKERDLVKVASRLAMAIRTVGESSLGRVKLVLESIADLDRRSKVTEELEKGCPKIGALGEGLQSILVKAASGSDNLAALHGVYDLLVKMREILAWETALALFTIETDESIEKPQVGDLSCSKPNGENVKSEKKSEKKKKKTLGKGTSVIRQLLVDRIVRGSETPIENVSVLAEWAQELSLYFDPKDAELDALLTKVKEIVESNEVRRLPKIPKGTRDFGKEQMAIRERAFSVIVGVFKRHGAVALDTPVFELRETLMGKYGEDSKLIYDLADQGGELCSLRYDLTVPFARYLAMNNLTSLKRYQIAKVYRRDNPSKGRYREFYQCDFDIAGQYEPMEPDFEVIRVITELLNELSIGDYEIKLNHRKLLDGMLEICGVSSEKFRTVCSSIDKLDKQSFEQVKKELVRVVSCFTGEGKRVVIGSSPENLPEQLVEEKGLAIETADRIGSFVKKRGPPLEILSDLKKEGSQFLENNGSAHALNDLEILFTALEKSKCLDKIVFDLSLARGLDYYTGVIYETVFKGATQVGSIAAGGRYDNLVGMFSGKQVPAVGVSLGIERVFTIMEQLEKEHNQVIRVSETQVLVAILGKDLSLAAELVSELWDAKIKAEFGLSKRPMNHISRAKQSGIPWMVILGESEVSNGIVKLKNIEANKEEEVPRNSIVEELQRRLNIS